MHPKARALRSRLDGALIPAVPVPFDADGKHDRRAEKTLVEYIAQSPAAGVALWVHTGRGLLLTDDDRHQVFKRWRIGLRDDQFIICGAGCPTSDLQNGIESLSDKDYIGRAVKMAETAKLYGAEGILVYAPVKFRGRPDQDEMIMEYHEAIASVGMPMILFYLYEAAGGISYDLELLAFLLNLPLVAGIKLATLDSVMTFQDVAEMAKAKAPEAALLTGEDRFLGYTIMRGAVGALIGMGCVQPAPQAELLSAWREGRFERFAKLSLAVDRFAETVFVQPMEGYIRRSMLALAMEKVLPPESTYDPWGPPITDGEIRKIAEALEGLKRAAIADAGREPSAMALADEPAGEG